MDTATPEQRSWMMSRIKGKDTTPEKLARAHLARNGVRYRCNADGLPGRPDISIKRYKLALEVRGCFWHGHENCAAFRLPKTRTRYWKDKIDTNKRRDKRNLQALSDMGFTVLEIWECEIKSGRTGTLDEFVGLYRERKGPG